MKTSICHYAIIMLSLIAITGLQSCADKCDSVYCSNGGTCDEGICDCPTGYSGPLCETQDPCNYVQWTGTGTCSGSGSYPVASDACCPLGYPFYFGTSCYATCSGAALYSNGATVFRYNNGSGGGTAGYICSGGNCSYVSSGATYAGLSDCQNACGNGGSSGYNCISGNCNYVSSGASYSSLSQCESNCGGVGSAGYDCVGGNCNYVSSGADYASLSQCESNCGGGSTGDLTFWTNQDLGCGNIYVTLTSYGTGTISGYYSSNPGCGASACANFYGLGYGAYSYTVTSDNGCTWNGNIQVSGSCQLNQLTL